MKVVFTKLTDTGYEHREFLINGLKYTSYIVAIDIVDIGWRTLTKEQYDSFVVTED